MDHRGNLQTWPTGKNVIRLSEGAVCSVDFFEEAQFHIWKKARSILTLPPVVDWFITCSPCNTTDVPIIDFSLLRTGTNSIKQSWLQRCPSVVEKVGDLGRCRDLATVVRGISGEMCVGNAIQPPVHASYLCYVHALYMKRASVVSSLAIQQRSGFPQKDTVDKVVVKRRGEKWAEPSGILRSGLVRIFRTLMLCKVCKWATWVPSSAVVKLGVSIDKLKCG